MTDNNTLPENNANIQGQPVAGPAYPAVDPLSQTAVSGSAPAAVPVVQPAADAQAVPAVQSKGKLLKILIPAVVAAALIIGGAVGFIVRQINVVIPAQKYDNANKLIAAEDYEGAIPILEDLGDYKDAAELKASCENQVECAEKYAAAEESLNNGDIAEAYNAFSDLGDYKDSSEKTDQIYDEYLSPIAQVRNADIGDIVYLTGDTDYTWRVLARDGDKVLLYETFENRKPDYTYDLSDVKSDMYWSIDSFTTNYYFTDRELTKHFVKPGTFIPDGDIYSSYIRHSNNFVSDGYPWVIMQGKRRRFEGSEKDYYNMRYIGIDDMLNGDKANGKFVFRVFVWIDVSD